LAKFHIDKLYPDGLDGVSNRSLCEAVNASINDDGGTPVSLDTVKRAAGRKN